jgi:lysozyme
VGGEPVIEALRAQLIQHEGLRLRPYRCTAGYLTVGVGRNLDANGISRDEAMLMLDNDIAQCIGQLRGAFSWFEKQDEIRQRALIDLCFNLGINGLLKFRNTLAAWARDDYKAAARGLEASRWFSQVGRRGPRIVHMVRHGSEPA